jgi:autotransporter-associated beta strand protein
MSVYQWIGGNDADLGNGGNWVDTTEPGMGQAPGTNDVAIIQVGAGLYGTLNVSGLDLVQASGAPPLSITGASTQVTAASVGIGLDFDLDDGAYLQAGTLGIDGDGTSVTVENNADLADSAGENDVFTIGASTGSASLLITRDGTVSYTSQEASGTLSLGGASNSVATLTVSDGGYFSSTLSSLNIGAVSGATGALVVTGADSQFLVDNYGYTTIGDFGELGGSAQGSVLVTDGGYASLSSDGEVDIGTSAGMAKVEVAGAESAIEAGPYVEIGEDGSNVAGEIIVESGGEFDTATDAYLNNGTIEVTGAGSLFTGRILATDQGAMVKLDAGGLIHVADIQLGGELNLAGGSADVRANLSMYGGSEIVGDGSITAAQIANAGMIVASGGVLAVNGSITGTGSEKIGAGATLQLNGAVAATQSILFDGAKSSLTLTSTASFDGRIGNFVSGDTLVDNGVLEVGAITETLAGTLAGSGTLLKASRGTLVLSGTESAFTGSVAISGGVVELASSGGLHAAITFSGAKTVAELKVDAADQPVAGSTFADALVNFDNSLDKLDLSGLAYVSGATATVSGSTLTLSDGGKTYKFTLGGTKPAAYQAISDGAGGTEIVCTAAAAQVASFTQAMASVGGAASGSSLVSTSAGMGAAYVGANSIAIPTPHGGMQLG